MKIIILCCTLVILSCNKSKDLPNQIIENQAVTYFADIYNNIIEWKYVRTDTLLHYHKVYGEDLRRAKEDAKKPKEQWCNEPILCYIIVGQDHCKTK